jgi:hypothetical protein
MEPEGEASDRNGGEEGCGGFGVTGGEAPPSFLVEERGLEQVAEFVQIFVVRPGDVPVLLWRDDRAHAVGLGLFKDRVPLGAFVSDQLFSVDPFDQATRLRAIRSSPVCHIPRFRPLVIFPPYLDHLHSSFSFR